MLADGTTEIVQTFVTYEKKMVADVIAAGGIPVVSSTTPNGDAWNDAHTAMLEGNRFVPYSMYAAGNYSSQGAKWIDHYGVSFPILLYHHSVTARLIWLSLVCGHRLRGFGLCQCLPCSLP